MKNMFKRSMLISIFSLVTLNVGTAQPASPSSIASRLKLTGQQWMRSLQRYSPNMTPQQKQRLITLTKRTSALIGAFLLALGLYAIRKQSRGKDEAPIEIGGPERSESVGGDPEAKPAPPPFAWSAEPAPAEGESVEELFESVRPATKKLTLKEMMEQQRRAREEAKTGRKRSYSE